MKTNNNTKYKNLLIKILKKATKDDNGDFCVIIPKELYEAILAERVIKIK